MKISASIYSDKGNDILQTIKDLNESMVDYIHVDCNDNLNVFADIQTIQQNSHIPSIFILLRKMQRDFIRHSLNLISNMSHFSMKI
ncbi:MAG: hypothetical protein IPM77_11030 [Crocinitomicaceae bacterium]|nr:hypothetical protein [Crocinitomicaceae bacterium]